MKKKGQKEQASDESPGEIKRGYAAVPNRLFGAMGRLEGVKPTDRLPPEFVGIEADERRAERERFLPEETRLERERSRVAWRISSSEVPSAEAMDALRKRELDMLATRADAEDRLEEIITSYEIGVARLADIDHELRELRATIDAYNYDRYGGKDEIAEIINSIPTTDTYIYLDEYFYGARTDYSLPARVADRDSLKDLNRELRNRFKVPKAKAIFAVAKRIKRYCDIYGIARIGTERMASEANISSGSASTYLKELITLGAIERTERYVFKRLVSGYTWTWGSKSVK